MNLKSKKLFKIISVSLAVVLWLIVWELVALIVGNRFIFPGAIQSIAALSKFFIALDFWKTVLASILRILAGFLLGIVLGCALAVLCRSCRFIYDFVSVGMTVVKSTPVASIIMILWVLVADAILPVLIAVLMVCPIIWQNLMDGYAAISRELDEVTVIYQFSKKKRFKLLVFPTLYRYFVPAALTSVGLAWKSGIAAEVISYTKNSIGRNIYLAKSYFVADELLAWTLTVVIISLAFEFSVKAIFRRLESKL